MQTLSLDLREWIVKAYESGEGSYIAIEERFSVGPTVVGKFVRQKRDLGTVPLKSIFVVARLQSLAKKKSSCASI